MANREDKIIHAVACPQCHAPRGSKCTFAPGSSYGGHGRLVVHSARKKAWQAQRVAESRMPDRVIRECIADLPAEEI